MGKNNKQYTHEYVNSYFESKDCILHNKYINSTTRLEYTCKCGTFRTITFNKFKQQKHGCRVCAGLEKYTQEQVKKYFEENGCKLISEYTGANDELTYMCSCGNISKNNFWNFRKGQRCEQCGLKKLNEQFKHDIEYVRKVFLNNNCIPLFNSYDNVHDLLDYECECGNKAKIRFSDFQDGERCNNCRVERIQKTMYKNGTQQCSTQQKYLYNLLGGELNYPVKNLSLDIAYLNEMIDIEFDGSGHDLSVKLGDISEKDFLKKEKNRRYALYRTGWKEIRIISKLDKLPSDEKIINMINLSKEYFLTKHSWIKFDIDNNKIICSQFNKDYDYEKLRKI